MTIAVISGASVSLGPKCFSCSLRTFTARRRLQRSIENNFGFAVAEILRNRLVIGCPARSKPVIAYMELCLLIKRDRLAAERDVHLSSAVRQEVHFAKAYRPSLDHTRGHGRLSR